MLRKNILRAGALGGAAVLLLSGCGLQANTTDVPEIGPGSLQKVPGAEGQKVTVASKNFTEQLVLGKILVLASEAAGYEVEDLTNVPGSQPVRNLMTSGDATATMEYTGTAWLTFLGNAHGIPDQQKQWQAVHDADLKNGLTWGRPSRLNNTYALAVRKDFAQKNGISTVSDLARLPVDQRTVCVESEFNSRSDGLNPLLKTYGLPRGSAQGVPDGNVSVMDTGTVYSATAEGKPCNVGEVFTTDGRIKALDLQLLQDDRHFFPAYNGSPVVNSEFLKKNPELMDRYEQVAQKLDDETMRELNLKVDVQGQDPGQVAYDWMVEQGFISKK